LLHSDAVLRQLKIGRKENAGPAETEGIGGEARANCGDRKSHCPFASDTSSKAPLAHKPASSANSLPTFSFPSLELVRTRRKTMFRFFCEAIVDGGFDASLESNITDPEKKRRTSMKERQRKAP